jgi:hypothetical protein
MGMVFMSTLAITGTIMTVTPAADGTLIMAAHPATRYRVEIARPTITAKCQNAMEAVPGWGGLSILAYATQALIGAPISPPGDRNADLRADCGDAMW